MLSPTHPTPQAAQTLTPPQSCLGNTRKSPWQADTGTLPGQRQGADREAGDRQGQKGKAAPQIGAASKPGS
jgi:hypothetical protein